VELWVINRSKICLELGADRPSLDIKTIWKSVSVPSILDLGYFNSIYFSILKKIFNIQYFAMKFFYGIVTLMEHIVHGSKVWLFCKKFTYLGMAVGCV